MIISASGVSALSYPFIGYDNVVTTTNVAALTSDTSYPASNVANPALNLRWQGAAAGTNYLTATLSGRSISYVAIAGHNFNSQNIPVSVTANATPSDSYTKVLMHFDVDFSDETGRAWTTNGGALIDTSKSRFGLSSGFFDGTGDYIDTPTNIDLDLGSTNWTIEFWAKVNIDGTDIFPTGRLNVAGGANINSSFYIARLSAGNVITALVIQGTTGVGCTSTTALNIAAGWMHVAFVRNGGNLFLYINGVAEGSAVISGGVNVSNAKLGIGSCGDFVSQPWNGWIDEYRYSNGIARYTANFTPPTAPFDSYVADAYMPRVSTDRVMLHFDGANNSTTFIDETGRPWTAVGNAKIDSVMDAGYFDGTGDNITTPDNPNLTLGTSDFTIEAWFNLTQPFVGFPIIAQSDVSGLASAMAWYLGRVNTGQMYVAYSDGAVAQTYYGTTLFSNTTNPGWHHIAVTRSGNVFRLFIDGVQEETHTQSITINNSSNVLTVGGIFGFGGTEWWGWLDEFRMSIGTARYTANFTPTPRASTSRVPPDDGPMVFRFPPIAATKVRLAMRAGDAAPQVAVMYVGTLLDMERSIDVNVTHTPINMGRQSRVASGKAENGKFIGRIVLGEWNAGSIDFKWFTPDWYRANFDPFLNAAVENPFFIAWNPVEYPLEVGYVALTEDAKPEVDTVTKRVHVKLDFQGESA